MHTAYEDGAQALLAYLDSPRGLLRTTLITERVLAELAGSGPLSVLDVGAGDGRIGAALHEAGHTVTYLEPAAQLLERAGPGRKIRGTLADLDALTVQYDLLLCHNVLEYTPELGAALGRLARLLRPGGRLSLVTLNHWQEPLRQALRGDLAAARRALTSTGPVAAIYGVQRRAVDGDDLQARMAGAGLQVLWREGIFTVADYLPDAMLGEDVLALERALRQPLAASARYLHLWAVR